MALIGFAEGFGVGHTEDVVGLDTAVNTTVAGDGAAEGQALGLLVNAVEDSGGGVHTLS